MKVKINMEDFMSDGNAYALLGKFRRAARKQGWSKEQVDAVLNKAMSGDYDNLLQALMEHIEFDEEE